MSYTIFNKCKIDKSRVPKCFAMTTNLRLKNPTCRAYILKDCYRTFQSNKQFYHGFDRNCWPKKQKSKTPRPRDQKFENPRSKETQENEISRLIQNAFEILRLEQKFQRPWIFRIPFATPLIGNRTSWLTNQTRLSDFANYITELDSSVLLPLSILSVNP